MQTADGCPTYPAMDIAAAAQPTSIYYHDATFWRCWGITTQDTLSGQVGSLRTELRQAEDYGESQAMRADLTLWGGFVLLVLVDLLYGVCDPRVHLALGRR